jgi:hypothetical protein
MTYFFLALPGSSGFALGGLPFPGTLQANN